MADLRLFSAPRKTIMTFRQENNKLFLRGLLTPQNTAVCSLVFIVATLVLRVIDVCFASTTGFNGFSFWTLLVFAQLLLACAYFCLAIKQQHPKKIMTVLMIGSLSLYAATLIHDAILLCVGISFLLGNGEMIFSSSQLLQTFLIFNVVSHFALIACFVSMTWLYVSLMLNKRISTRGVFSIFLISFVVLAVINILSLIFLNNLGFEITTIATTIFMLPMTCYAVLSINAQRTTRNN